MHLLTVSCFVVPGAFARCRFGFGTVVYLTVRYPKEDKSAGSWHLHDFMVSEMNKLSQAGAGTLVLAHLAALAIFSKARLGIMDTLPAAKLIASTLVKVPGHPRCDHVAF